jgi:hypothetical protein
VKIDAIKVPKNTKMQIAAKLEKNGLWKKQICRFPEHNIPS